MLAHVLKQKMVLIFTLSCIAFSFFFQMFIPINANSAWHLQVAMQLMQGKQLYKDIIEINMPLIYYLRIIPVWLSGWIQTPLWWASVLFNFGLALGCYYLCMWVLHRSSYKDNVFFIKSHQLILAIIIFLLPLWSFYNLFGEKEHLFLILTLPYLLTMFCTKRFWDDEALIHGIIGLMAAVGFCIKPYFVILFLAAELYRFCYKKNIIPLWRIEAAIVLAFGISYLIMVGSYFPDYITKIIPMGGTVYQHLPWYYFFLSPFLTLQSAIFISVIPLWAERKRFEHYYFCLAIACVISASLLLNHMSYYFFPAIAFCCMILFTRIGHVAWLKSWLTKRYFFSAFIGGVFCILFIGIFYNSTKQLFERTVLNKFNQYDALTSYVDQYKNKGPVFMLANFDDIFPLIVHKEVKWNYGMSTPFIVAGTDRYFINHPNLSTAKEEALNSYYQWYETILMKDLNTTAPSLIIMNNSLNYPINDLNHWIGHKERHAKFTGFKELMEGYEVIGLTPIDIPEKGKSSFTIYARKEKN